MYFSLSSVALNVHILDRTACNATCGYQTALIVGVGFEHEMFVPRDAFMTSIVGAIVGQIFEIMWTWIAACEGWGCNYRNGLSRCSQPRLCGGGTCLIFLCLHFQMWLCILVKVNLESNLYLIQSQLQFLHHMASD